MTERDMNELHDTTEKCCSILRATNDGNNLAPKHLALLELCVNGDANKAGYAELDRIYKEITEQGGYKKSFLHGVENMTVDNAGYVSTAMIK